MSTDAHVHNYQRQSDDSDEFICSCGQMKTPRCLLQTDPLPPPPSSPGEIEHGGHDQTGEAHRAYLQTLRGDTGKHGLTYDEAHSIFYRYTNMRGWAVAENLLRDRITDFPGIHSLDAYRCLMHTIFGLSPKSEPQSVPRSVKVDKSHVERPPNRKLHWHRKDYSRASNGR